ncbi:hypothetical protein EIP91_008746 [Steccherinum ochraceum]|uniref:Transmembrane protein n=1 Tax=Steccherinum ochraceum TaxID=92696 RepID=A0A4R0S065_9APHY|nr:hypothetical protein EIP91_008746 [Steccherinum ochraceum]
MSDEERDGTQVPAIHTVSPTEASMSPRKEYQDYFGSATPGLEVPRLFHGDAKREASPVRSVAEKEKDDENTLEGQSDLLLDIAMTTAFASLLDGTPIIDARSLASFLCVFVLVWWIWASQVAYNARFRKFNWPHRVFLFFQLLVFCAFAAFTNNFDIENGIVDDSSTAQELSQLRQDEGYSNSVISAAAFTENRTPVLNIRGLSMTMAFSRILLLAEYLYAWGVGKKHEKNRRLFLVQCGAILISIGCYLAAFFVIGDNPSRVDQIVKLVLWFFPVILEIASHFVVALLAEADHAISVKYDAATFRARSATVFIIILGGGLDNITQGFHFMVGNLSFGAHRIGVIFCASVIFILLFTLHFTTIPDPEREDVRDEGEKRRRDLGLFFFEFVYLCAVVITLQGMAAMLQVGNVGDSMQTALQFLRTSEAHMNSTNFATPLSLALYDPDTLHRLKTDGYDINGLLTFINSGIPASSTADATLVYENLLVQDMQILSDGLNIIHALSEDAQNILSNEISAFLSPNYTDVNRSRFIEVAEMAITVYATPALWFSSAGGAILVFLGVMALIDRWRRLHKFALIQVFSRFILGALLIVLVALDAHASTVFLDANYEYTGSRIWRLATQSWILPPYALVLLLEQLWEYILVYLARRTYKLSKARYEFTG